MSYTTGMASQRAVLEELLTATFGPSQEIALDTAVTYFGYRELGLPRQFRPGSGDRLSFTAEKLTQLQTELAKHLDWPDLDLFALIEDCPKARELVWPRITAQDVESYFVDLAVSGAGYTPTVVEDSRDLCPPSEENRALIAELDRAFQGFGSYTLLRPRPSEFRIRRQDLLDRLQRPPAVEEFTPS